MKLPKISIIVPVFNVENYLNKCLDSLKNQTLSDIEIIVVDDGSQDHSARIATEYSLEDSRFIVIRQQNKKQGGARNTGLKYASGKYVAFVDADDWVDEDFCESMYLSAVTNDSDIVLVRQKLYLEDEKKIVTGWFDFSEKVGAEYIQGDSFIKYFTPVCGRLYSRDLINKYNLRFVEDCFYEDNSWGCFITLINPKISFGPTRYYYRRHSGSTTYKKDSKVLDWFRDAKYLDNFIKNSHSYYSNDRIKMCYIWYVYNFYSYYHSIESNLKLDFCSLMKETISSWDLALSDFSIIPSNNKTQRKIYNFYADVKTNGYHKNIGELKSTSKIRIFGLPFAKVDRYNEKTKYYLFNILCVLKIKINSKDIKRIYLFGFIPFIKVHYK